MAFPNISDITTTTLEKRSGTIADNVTANSPLLTRLQKRGNIRPFSGGRLIYEELAFAMNGNGGWYTGYDTLSVAAADVISAAEFAIKQLAVPVTMSGLEELQNSGSEQVIDLLESRIKVAEATMNNLLNTGLFSDGTGTGSKQLTGLHAAVPIDPTTGTYGAIDRSVTANIFWRSQLTDNVTTAATIQTYMNALYAKCCRGSDAPDLISAGATQWSQYLASCQALQRFTGSEANLGFPSIKFMNADVVLDGGVSGAGTATEMFFLNTKYLFLRPHKDRNMVPLKKRQSTNQDAEISILAWAGNLTCSGAQFQGLLTGD